MEISTAASTVIPRPREEVFQFACANATFERHLRPRGPIAGIEKAEMFEGQPLAEGSWRRISMTDGSVLEEVILDYVPPSLHRYRWTKGIKPPFSWLVRSGTGRWDFTEVDGGTRIDWGYVFELKSPLFYPLLLLIVPIFRGWLQRGLDSIRSELVA
jgi:uncharacterized protein YndB with AHSA1/START domain